MTTKKTSRKRKELDITHDIGESIKKNFDCSNLQLKRLLPLTDNQMSFYYKSQDPKTNIVFVDGLAGSAKAQPLSERVPTPSGWKTMGDLKIGDKVFSVDGEETVITGIFPQGIKKINTIHFSDGTSTRCCDDHLWNTSTYNDRNRWNTKIIDGEKVNISKIDPIYKTVTTEHIKNSLYHKGRINHMIPIVESPVNYVIDKKLPLDSYIMGLLIGDGCFRITPIRISTTDEEIVKYLSNVYGDDLKHLSGCDYRISKIKDVIVDLGLYNLYSHEKFIPEIYKLSPVEDRISLIQGLLDSDGSCSKSGSVTYTTTSKQLAYDVVEVVNSLGGIAHISDRIGYLKNVQHKNYYKLTINLPKEFIPFRLTRKLKNYTPNTKYSPKRYIQSVSNCGEEECVCIMVDHPSHLYLTNNYIVTHNTYIAVYAALELLKNRQIDHIIYVRTVVESSSRSIGALPGELDDKFSPYSMPLVDKLNEIVDLSTSKSLMEHGYIKAIPVNFVRGLTFHNSAVIIDESQNMNKTELTTVLTRFGKNTKYFVCGDSKQKDIKDSGFETVYNLFDTEFSRKNNIHTMKFDSSDVVRSIILKHITQVLGV